MTPHRFFVALLQPLLALLLIAGMAQVLPVAFAQDNQARMIGYSPVVLTLSVDSTEHPNLQGNLPLGENNSDDGPDTALLMSEAEAIIDVAHGIRTGRVAYRATPSSHRPCAAPPTGPPLI